MNNQKEPWRESLFDVCASPSLFCKGFCCPECVFGDNVVHITNGSYCAYCCGYSLLLPFFLCGLIHMPIRARMREKYNLKEEPSDFVAACLLSPCGVCQEAREIISRERTSSAKARTNQPTKGIASPADSEVASATSSTNAS